MVNGLFITTLSFLTGAIVTVYNHAIGLYNLFQKCNLFHHRLKSLHNIIENIFLSINNQLNCFFFLSNVYYIYKVNNINIHS